MFEHCARALDQSLAVGSHGLPLIGTGDWNDGLNLVGAGGKGESIWLGWFLHATLSAFAKLADSRRRAGARRGLAAARQSRWRDPWSAKAGTATGTCALSSMTEHHWVPPQAANAE